MMRRDDLRRRLLLGAVAACGAAIAPRVGRAQSSLSGQALPSTWTNAETITLWNGAPPGGGFASPSRDPRLPARLVTNVAMPELKVFRPQVPNGRALLSIPGGGYAVVSVLNEGLDVAQRMTDAGYTVFVLVYRLPGEGWRARADVPLQDAQRAMRVIRSRAQQYGFDARNVALVGFSAGGHLAASLATAFAEPVYAPLDQLDRLDARPSAAGLIYPVIALDGPFAHQGSAAALLGPDPSAELLIRRSPTRHVSATTPPVFLAHAADDRVVPLENSLLMLAAMKEAGRPAEAHLFPRGGHGFGLGAGGARPAEWPALFTRWLDDVFRGDDAA